MPLPDCRRASYGEITRWFAALHGDEPDWPKIDARWRALGSGLVQRQSRDDTPGARWRREKRR